MVGTWFNQHYNITPIKVDQMASSSPSIDKQHKMFVESPLQGTSWELSIIAHALKRQNPAAISTATACLDSAVRMLLWALWGKMLFWYICQPKNGWHVSNGGNQQISVCNHYQAKMGETKRAKQVPFLYSSLKQKKHEFRIVSTWNKQVDRRSSSTKDRNPQANFVITRLLAQEQKQKR